VLFTYPLELVRVRMAFETRHTRPPSTLSAPAAHAPIPRPSISHVMSLIYAEGRSAASTQPTLFTRFPLLNFYRGFTVTIAGMVPYAGTSFLAWGYLRSRFIPPAPDAAGRGEAGRSRRRAKPATDLAFGAISGALAQTASYPFEVVRRRMQVGGLTNPGRWMRWGETAHGVWRDAVARAPPDRAGLARLLAGARGFYVGLSIGYLKVVPMTAISYMVWEAGKQALGV
jgi:solute carrier family 25 protein 16